MTTAVDPSAVAAPPTHPRDRSMESWRSRLGLLASRGETDGPRVEEVRAALTWHRTYRFFVRETDATPEQADALLNLIYPELLTASTTAVAR